MPVTELSRNYHVLCHEHHLEMRLHEILLESGREGKQILDLAFACTEPDCRVHYNFCRGYFLPSQEARANELGMVPRLRCPRDDMSLYLAGINPQRRGFRLWKCPQCDGKCTNDEGLLL
jgi:hypothetical protein